MATAAGEGTARDFDFWMGSWNVRNRRLRRRFAGSDEWDDAGQAWETSRVMAFWRKEARR